MSRALIIYDLRALMYGIKGGVALCAYHLLKYLLLNDQQNDYLLFYNARKDINMQLPKIVYDRQIPIINTKVPNKIGNLASLFGQPKFDKLIDKHHPLSNYDQVIFFMPDARPVALTSKTKLITLYHDLSFEHHREYFSWYTGHIWHRVVRHGKNAKRCDLILAPSQYTKDDLIRTYQINPKIIHVIKEAAEDTESKDTNPTINVIEKYQIKKPYLIFFGTLEPRKNLTNLVKAFINYQEEFHDLNLVIVGRPDLKIFRQTFDFDMNKRDDIQVISDFVTATEKYELIRQSQALTMVSFLEGFGLPVVESLSVSKPVLIADNTSLPEIAGDAGVTVDPHNIQSIKNGIITLQNQETYAKLCNAAKERGQMFDWGKAARKVIGLLNGL